MEASLLEKPTGVHPVKKFPAFYRKQGVVGITIRLFSFDTTRIA
jgi:hypothetical protein